MNQKQVNDLRGEPTFACICGCAMFRINVMWDQETRAVGWYDLAQECVECGTITTAPTEIDGCEERRGTISNAVLVVRL